MYITTITTRSVRSTARFHSITIAIRVPAKGTTTPARFAYLSTRVMPVSISCLATHFLRQSTAWRPRTYKLSTIHGAVDHPARERHRRQAIDRVAEQHPGLELVQQVLEVVALGAGEAAAAAAADAHQRDQPPALGRGQAQHVVAGQQGHLGRRQQLEHRNAPEPGDAAGGLADGHVHETRGHTSSLGSRPARPATH